MDAKELRTIIDGVSKGLPAALLENKQVESLVYSINRISSYLESEQAKRKELTDQMVAVQATLKMHAAAMEQFDKTLWGDKDDLDSHPGMAHEWTLARKQSKRNEKLIVGVLIGVLTQLFLGVLYLLASGKIPLPKP